MGAKLARETTEELLSVFEVAAVDGPALHAALALRWTDFEDAMTAAARRSRCDVVVTRNARHFNGSPVKALTPSETVAWLSCNR